jgi:uncharacterized spore protein YtfJ
MEDVEKLFKTAIEEIERMLSTKRVVGEPITVEGNTLIPLVSVGFGFGAGGASGMCPVKADKTEGYGGGTGGGGGVKPIAVIIINKDGVRLESIKGAAGSLLEKVAETIGNVACKRGEESPEK